ncbi:hypothetical protein BUALT_Bualt16G0050400 [Buddleja alternifolia]|uniref:Serine aminopeptidase S33 domain-containing protein n=1 Tax=Buddleja alternifolia TaxID=168488 RepID=A0AAV6WB04_9LAMI|nr:hypothetical protein BUALT_Bualt16G0050400 [Buddleja alternifolia]
MGDVTYQRLIVDHRVEHREEFLLPHMLLLDEYFSCSNSYVNVLVLYLVKKRQLGSISNAFCIRRDGCVKWKLRFHSYNGFAAMQQKITIQNKRGEKLVGVLHDTGSEKIAVLCHGFQSTKVKRSVLVSIFVSIYPGTQYHCQPCLAAVLGNEGIRAFCFDFSGNGECEGIFEYGNYLSETEDLRAVIEYFSGLKRSTVVVLGHSKGI